MNEDLVASHAVACYLFARDVVIRLGYEDEICWQRSVTLDDVTETSFMREAAWVILSAGMRERVIRRIFPLVSEAFFDWRSAQDIVENTSKCRDEALRAFGNAVKIESIVSIVRMLAKQGFEVIKLRLAQEGLDFIVTLPYMGPATSAHLCKNLGLAMSKADRHLLRISEACGFPSPDELCACISRATGESLSVVDIVLWRYATVDDDYLDLFRIIPLALL